MADSAIHTTRANIHPASLTPHSVVEVLEAHVEALAVEAVVVPWEAEADALAVVDKRRTNKTKGNEYEKKFIHHNAVRLVRNYDPASPGNL